MFKTVARNMQDLGISSAGDGFRKQEIYYLVYFRFQADNRRRERVFRFVKEVRGNRSEAEKRFNALLAPLKVLVAKGQVLIKAGDEAFAEKWRESRRGINAGADPYLAADYHCREFSRNSTLQ